MADQYRTSPAAGQPGAPCGRFQTSSRINSYVRTLVGIYNADDLKQIIWGKSCKRTKKTTQNIMLPTVVEFFPPFPPAYTDLYIPIFTVCYSEKTNRNIQVEPIELWANIMAKFCLFSSCLAQVVQPTDTTFPIHSFKFYFPFLTHLFSFLSPYTQTS